MSATPWPVTRGRPERRRLIEVNLGEGCVAVPLSNYRTYNTRICRASGLAPEDRDKVVDFMIGKLGLKYDHQEHYSTCCAFSCRRRRCRFAGAAVMLAFGSGDPTRAICSSLIAEAYGQIRYPILPEITRAPGRASAQSSYLRREILHIRHHSLYTPRDFDLSPYFRIVKPTLEYGFDYRAVTWDDKASTDAAAATAGAIASDT